MAEKIPFCEVVKRIAPAQRFYTENEMEIEGTIRLKRRIFGLLETQKGFSLEELARIFHELGASNSVEEAKELVDSIDTSSSPAYGNSYRVSNLAIRGYRKNEARYLRIESVR